jgi:hypothetical protein
MAKRTERVRDGRLWVTTPDDRFVYAHSDVVYRLLGVRPGQLPVEGMPERVIHGVRVYVRPLPPKVGQRRNWDGLRVMAICECGRHVAVGRLHQHVCMGGVR